MTALALSPAYETRWTIVSGPMSGMVRVMQNAQFHIGRSPECEFAIPNDPKCSRKHALVAWAKDGCHLTSLSESNPVQVNGRDQQKALLKDGDVLLLGETQIQFNLVNVPAAVSGSGELEVVRDESVWIPPQPQAPAAHYRAPHPGGAPRPGARRGKPAPQGNGLRRLILYGVVGGLLWFFLSPSAKKKEELAIRSQQQIEADIEAAKKLKESADQNAAARLEATMAARQAQENYVRGFRDYRDGQYERSLVNFQACLALYPEHVLCNRYHRLAKRKFDELVQTHVILGRKYREQNQFKACRASYRNVMFMVKDANSNIYREAKANFDACNALAEGKF